MGKKLLIAEIRNPNGTLNVKADLPVGLNLICSEEHIMKFYFSRNEGVKSADMKTIYSWLNKEFNVSFRPKNW